MTPISANPRHIHTESGPNPRRRATERDVFPDPWLTYALGKSRRIQSNRRRNRPKADELFTLRASVGVSGVALPASHGREDQVLEVSALPHRPFLIARNGSAQAWLPFKGPAPGYMPGNLVTVRARRERSFERSGYRRNAHFYDRPTFSHCDMRELLPPGCDIRRAEL